MRRTIQRNLAAAVVATACLGPHDSSAAPLDPNAFTSLGALPGGSFTIDTTALTFDGIGGGVLVSQGGALPDIAVFTFDGGATLGAGATIDVTGDNALAILFKGPARLQGTVDVSGGDGTPGGRNLVGIRGIGVAGGGDGGNGGPFSGGSNGQGPGGGTLGTSSASGNGTGTGGGGAFGTDGGPGGAGVTSVPGGVSYGGPPSTALEAGSGGGGGGGTCCVGRLFNGGSGGGAGGGIIEIGALELLDLAAATILADGGDGGQGFRAGGGGAGGSILLHAFSVSIDASSIVQANGGVGGGCGGGGRVELVTNTAGTLVQDGTVQALGGGAACNDTAPLLSSLPNIGRSPAVGAPPIGVPEPSTWALLTLGLAGLGSKRRRKKRS